MRCLVLLFWLSAAAALSPPATAHERIDDWLRVSAALRAGANASVDFTPNGTQPGLFDLVNSDNCAGCHAPATSSPPSASTFLPHSTWAGSMMANATRDPLFWAALDVANHDVPGVGDYCLRCHAAKPWYEGRIAKNGAGGLNDATRGPAGCLLNGSYDRADDPGNDFSGVPCHYCHRLMPQGPRGEPGYVGNADAWVDDAPCNGNGAEPCRRGPYDYAAADLPPPHAWQASPYHLQSDICGLCHNVSSPDLANGPLKTLKLNDGTETGHAFPIERTFGEWQQSQYASAPERTCQSCHMPTSSDANALACTRPGYPSRANDLPVHEFAGANTWVPGLIRGEFGHGLGSNRMAALTQTINRARAMLQGSATVDTNIQNYAKPTATANGTLTIRAAVTNLSGHKLPTGYAEGRRMWLDVAVRDATNALVYESGAYDAATGVLTRDPSLRVYEVAHGVWNRTGTHTCETADVPSGPPTFHFALSDCIARDTRIPPLGFRPATAADPDGYDLRPVGANYPETTAGSGTLVNYDVADYAIAIPAGTPTPLSISVKLYYQTASKEYVDFLRDEASSNGFPDENTLCAGAANRPLAAGPQNRTRGEYVHELWDRPYDLLFADGYEGGVTAVPGHSPVELVQSATAVTSD